MGSTTLPSSVEGQAGEQQLAGLARREGPAARVQRVLHAHPALGPFMVLVVSCLVFGLLNSRFLTTTNISLMLQQVAVIAALGVGQTLIILTAGIDLSIGYAMVLSLLVMAKVSSEHNVPGPLALLLGFAVAMGTGAVNGTLITRLRVPPFIATLGMLFIFQSSGLLYANGQTTQAAAMPSILNWTGRPVSIGPFDLINGVLVVAVLYLVVNYVMNQTTWGRHVYAVGDDVEAARLAGIRTSRVLFSVYVFAGLVVGVAGWISIGYAGAADPNNAVDANLQSITAVVIGGTSLFGGRGGVIGTLFGALIVVAFTSGLTLANVNDLYQPMAEGVLVIAAVAVDQWIRRVKP
ncbi:ABC transporter permease [Conexibacter woesei]|uniref:ABC transporter permease n=1 Tax=Conexibacter woesei TaxID=191495 RepID=UPI00047B4F3A|nr:ABC transporter permease [Conexibacter woesei]